MEDNALLEYVINVSRRLAETRTLEPLLAYILDEVLQLVGAEHGYIVFAKPNRKLDFKLKRDRDGNTLKEDADRISYSILNEVINTNKPLIIRNAMVDPRFSQAHSVRYLQLRSIMCVPFISRHQTIGALYMENRSIHGRFQDKDLATLELFAKQAAVAIENAALNEELKMAYEHKRLRLEQEHLHLQNEVLEKQARGLAKLNADKDKFFSIVSHDLLAPFGVLITGANFLVDAFEELSTAEIKQLLQNLHRAGQTTYQLLESLLTWSRLQMGRIDHHPNQHNLYTLAHDCVAVLWEMAITKKISLTNTIAPDIFVFVDEHMLATIFRNLVSNAIKFTNEGGQVTMACQRRNTSSEIVEPEEESVEVSVSDTGIGISPKNLDRLLQIGTQYTTPGTAQEKGTGLGLIICQEMVHKNGGKMQIESEVGVGTSVCFTLPLSISKHHS